MSLSVHLERPKNVHSCVLLKNSGSRALFTGPTGIFFNKKKIIKLGLMVLFTYLKIILLQCFQFSAIGDIQTDSNYQKSCKLN